MDCWKQSYSLFNFLARCKFAFTRFSESSTVTVDYEPSENPVNESQDSPELIEEISVKDVDENDMDGIAT